MAQVVNVQCGGRTTEAMAALRSSAPGAERDCRETPFPFRCAGRVPRVSALSGIWTGRPKAAYSGRVTAHSIQVECAQKSLGDDAGPLPAATPRTLADDAGPLPARNPKE